MAQFAQPPEPTYSRNLYRADADDILDVLRSTSPDDVLLIVGHNPTIAQVATTLAEGSADPGTPPIAILSGFPAGAAAVFECNANEDPVADSRLVAFFAA